MLRSLGSDLLVLLLEVLLESHRHRGSTIGRSGEIQAQTSLLDSLARGGTKAPDEDLALLVVAVVSKQ